MQKILYTQEEFPIVNLLSIPSPLIVRPTVYKLNHEFLAIFPNTMPFELMEFSQRLKLAV